jgi:hypothetical protein
MLNPLMNSPAAAKQMQEMGIPTPRPPKSYQQRYLDSLSYFSFLIPGAVS